MTNPPRFEGLAEDKITWYSNEEQQSTCGSLGLADVKLHGFKPDFFDVPMDFRFGKVWNCRVLKLHMVLEDVITSLASKNQHLDFNVLRFWERKKLQGTQTTTITKPRRCTVWKRKKLQGSQAEMVHLYYANLYYATNTKKLQGTQTQETQSDARHRV